ncbi:MAG: DUF1549 domain-containing protein, partial [Planctomycetes bacterium]|nr:DUF1549 domain-containing protein [Planctomycetota bacterium]
FDRFTIEQLAGDLLVPAKAKKGIGEVGPRAPLIRDEKHLNLLVATAFNRNHRGNAEGGIIPEEYQVEYVVDRVDTTFTTWLGLTIGCARCHDHKYDPVSQREFYQAFAYFNNIPEYGRAIKEGNSPPYIKAPTKEQLRELTLVQKRLDDLGAPFAKKFREETKRLQRQWEKTVDVTKPIRWTDTRGLVARFEFDGGIKNVVDKSPDSKVEAGQADFVQGKRGKAMEFDGKRFVDAGDVAKLGYFDRFSVTAWVYPTGDRTGTIISRMSMIPRGDGYYIHLNEGKVQVNLVKRWLDDSIRVETQQELQANAWQHLAVTYDGSRVAKGITVYVNGQPLELKIHHDFLNQTMANDEPLRIGAGHSAFKGRIDDVRIYNRKLSTSSIGVIAATDSINEIVAIPENKRSRGQAVKLARYFMEHHAPKRIQEQAQEFVRWPRRLNALRESSPTLMVMHEMEKPRDTFILDRGQCNKPGKKVSPGVPSILPAMPKDAPDNRLGFARWLVDGQNPLTARVAMNRYWSMYFGQGLVRTMEDFGTQGQRPSHPQLVDWLASEACPKAPRWSRLAKRVGKELRVRPACAHPSRSRRRCEDA